MTRTLYLSLLSLFFLTACADLPKDVPIEDRSGKAVRSNAAATKPAGTESGTVTPAAKTDATQTAATPADVEAKALAQQQVETHALPATTESLQAINATQQGHVGGKNPLRDPDSLLSRRIIHFDLDSSAIREEYTALIEAHAVYLKESKEAKVILQGHTDERGSREYNLGLGQRRAESVQKSFLLLGVPEAQMEPVSLGEEKPLAEGQDEAAWQQNRRVEIHYQGE